LWIVIESSLARNLPLGAARDPTVCATPREVCRFADVARNDTRVLLATVNAVPWLPSPFGGTLTLIHGEDSGKGVDQFKNSVVHANGIRFATLEAGDGPLVLCLHGFPDHARSFRHQLPALAAAGFRAVAPYMRGYSPTETPADGRYQSAVLAQDALALIDALGYSSAHVFGHDWGALAAYGAAMLAPQY